jgi:hypothetical protein
MARIRTIKPTFWGDDKVSELSRDARFLMIGLISMADDSGRFLASPAAVMGFVYPNDDDVTPVKVRRWMDEIAGQGIIRLYNGGRVHYGAFPKWRNHQKINRPQKSTLPAPPHDGLFPEGFSE